MSAVSNRALDKPGHLNDLSDNHQTSAPRSDNPLLQQSGRELSNPNNTLLRSKIQEKFSNPTARNGFDSIDNLVASLTLTGMEKFKSSTSLGSEKQNFPDKQSDKSNKTETPHAYEPTRHEIRIYKHVEIHLPRVHNRGTSNLQQARKEFLNKFAKHGGDSITARKYIDHMVNIHHMKAQYAKENPNERVYYVNDKKLAACINEYSKVLDAKRTGTAAQFSDRQINGKLLRLVAAVGKPEEKLNQGQIGSCALHSAIGYIVEKDPARIAAVGSQLLRKGEFRGAFSVADMSAASGQDDINHMLGTAMKRCVYKGDHLTSGYGGTDSDNLAKGIKRMTHGKLHAVWSDDKTVSNGSDLDISYGGSHCQRSICRVFKENGKLVMKEKMDNTWNGYADGSWKITHGATKQRKT